MAHLTYGGCYAAFYGTRPPVQVQVPFNARIARSFDLAGELRVLDIGCGTGRPLAPLAALGWHVVGMGPQVENLAEARETRRSRGRTRRDRGWRLCRARRHRGHRRRRGRRRPLVVPPHARSPGRCAVPGPPGATSGGSRRPRWSELRVDPGSLPPSRALRSVRGRAPLSAGSPYTTSTGSAAPGRTQVRSACPTPAKT
ncbi:MAG: methyltransferase domain-containing protein [Acidimicrobiales bacterium]